VRSTLLLDVCVGVSGKVEASYDDHLVDGWL